MQALIGQKREQTQKFLEDGTRIPVTLVSLLGGNVVTQIRTTEKEGYNSVQVGISSKKRATKAMIGHVKGANLEKAPLFLRELEIEGDMPTVGTVVKATEVLAKHDENYMPPEVKAALRKKG